MRKLLFALIGAVTLFSCKKENTTQIKDKDIVLYYRLAIQKLDETTTVSKVMIARTRYSVTSDKSNTESAHEDDSHYDGDGCNENDSDFCKKHPTHRKCANEILPLTLNYFYVQVNNNYVGLYWKVTMGMENEVKQYIIERSEDGKTFKPVIYVEPQGTQEEYIAIDWIKE